MENLEMQSKQFSKAMENGVSNVNNKAAVNAILKDMERALTKEHGLPKRPWYKHHIYAPGFYTGYGVKTLPGVREAIEQGEFNDVEEQINILSAVINEFSTKIGTAISLMN
jgi:N-acetylated-alpha-linked acidic dipeptidase